MRTITTLIIVLTLLGQSAFGQDRAYPPHLAGAKVEVYKTVGDVKLNVYIYHPDGHKASDERPAMVFFFGGGWTSGSPSQFQEQCKYLASRGMVAMTADYRVASRHQTKAVSCVADAKSAVRWVRANADRLGIDPNRIAAGGGSAGGHITACTGVVKGFDESTEDASVSSVPNAMVLFNPALVLAAIDGEQPFDAVRLENLQQRMGVDPIALSPYHQVKAGAPPTIIFHGEADTTVTFKSAKQFTEAMTKASNRCQLIGYEGQAHGFFNYGRGDNSSYLKTVRAMDEFLTDLGYLEGEPTIEVPK